MGCDYLKKILILCNIYQASPRIACITKYLHKHNYKVYLVVPYICKNDVAFGPRFDLNKFAKIHYLETRVVGRTSVTSNNSKLKVFFDKSPILGKVSRAMYYNIRTIYKYNDEDYQHKKQIFDIASKIIEKEKINLILTSSPSVTYNIIAKDLKKRYKNIKWVADLRDLWADNSNINLTKKLLDSLVEPNVLKFADVLTTVSQPLVKILEKKYPLKSVFRINNGFDPDDYKSTNKFAKSLDNNKLRFTYSGNIYFGKHNPEILLEAISNLINKGKISVKHLKLSFYIPDLIWFKNLVLKYKLSDIVEINKFVSSKKIVEIQMKSHALIVFNWMDPKQKGNLHLKLYEAMAARRPIFAIGGCGSDEIEKLLKQTNAGFYLKNVKETEARLLEYYNFYIKTKSVPYFGIINEINQYSYENMARKFENIFSKI
jgi:hypothetical protein